MTLVSALGLAITHQEMQQKPAHHGLQHVKELAMSASQAVMIIFDNIQHQAHLQDHRIGHSAKMILGTYATAVEHQHLSNGEVSKGVWSMITA
jgi:hypothetical protein